MNEQRPPAEFEEQVRQAWAAPDPSPDFAARLGAQLAARGMPARPAPKRFTLRWAGALALAGLVLVVLAVVLAVGPQQAAGAVRQLFGFIPGIGVVRVDDSLRALVAPVSATRDGVTLTVRQAILSADRTTIDFVIDGVPASAYPKNENIPDCIGQASLRLPDGTLLAMTGGGGQGWASGYEDRYTYPPIAAGINTATLVLPCVSDTLPGKAPENWEVALSFVPAPASLALAPVMEVTAAPAPTAAVPATPEAGTATGAATAAASAAAGGAAPYGIAMVLDRYITLSDGYYLIGHTTWTDPRLSGASLAVVQLFDARGQELPIDIANFQDVGIDQPQPGQWVYRIYGLGFNSPLTLRGSLAAVDLQTPVAFALEAAPNGYHGSAAQLGQSWPVGPIALDVLGLPASLTQVTYARLGVMAGFKFSFQADAALQQLPLTVDGGVTNGNSGGGGSNRAGSSGPVESLMLTNGQIGFPLSLSVRSAAIAGKWETTWNPPLVAGQAPAVADAPACLTLAGSKQAAANLAALPAGLGGRVAVYGRITQDGLPPSPDNYGLFVSGLDGSGRRVLGAGTWPDISPDGTRAAYNGSDGLHVVDLASGQNRALPGTTTNDYSLRWSRDGARIAFIRGDEHAVYVIGADGRGLRHLADNAEYVLGWAPGDAQLYDSTSGAAGQQVSAIDPASGAIQPGMTLGGKDAEAALSPDGQWLAFTDHVRGKQANGLFVAHLDGSARRLIAQLDTWGIGSPVWSPDGQWLIASVTDTDPIAPVEVPALINLQSCQAMPLGIEGTVQGWVK
jgi:WD40-like Beta Propeller Repeat